MERAALSYGYGLSVSAVQLAQAYAVLANDGVKVPLTLKKVDGIPQGEQVLGKTTARQLVQMLEKPW